MNELARRGQGGVDGGVAGDLNGALSAGLLTFVTTVAYSSVAGAPFGAATAAAAVVSGLIGASVGGLVAAGLCPLGVQVYAPRASVAVVIAAAAVAIDGALMGASGGAAQTLAWLGVCLLLAAALQALCGLLRLGGVIRLVPHGVTAGFTLGIAIELAWAQRAVLWPQPAEFGGGGFALAPWALGAVALAAAAIVRQQRMWPPLRSGALPIGFVLALAACEAADAMTPGAVARLPALDPTAPPFTSLAAVFSLGAGSAGAAFIDGLPRVLPQVLLHAVVIAFVNSLEVLTCTMALESRLARRVDANRALLASAAGSAVALAAGGLPVAGGMAASLANANAGARTRRSALAAAAGIAALAVAAQAVLAPLPLAALAGVTLAVAAALAWTPLRQAWQWCVASRRAGRAGRVGLGAASGDGAIAALVTGLLLSFGSAAALVGGVMAASLLALLRLRRGAVRRTYDAPRPGLDTAAGATRRRSCRLPDDVRIVEVGQPLLFANVEAVVQALEAQPVSMRRVIVDLTRANAVDHSAVRTLAQCGVAWAADGRALIVVRGVRARNDDWPAFDGCTVFDRLDDALAHAFDRALHTPSHASSHLAPAARATPIAMPPRADAAGEPAAERATRLLLPLLGPIAPLLVRRAERGGASDEQRRQRLALHLPEGAQRQAFLRAMTNQDINLQGPPRAGRCPSRPPEGAPENLGRPGVFLKEPST